MSMLKRNLVWLVLIGSFLHGGVAVAQHERFPARPLKVIVPFAVGGAGDVVARILGDRVRAALGQGVIVENQSGGNTIIGTQLAARASADGYTLLQMTPSNITVAAMQKNLPYDLERDFTPVMSVGAVPMALVVPAKSKIRSVAELVAAAKATPEGLFYASGGSGSLTHLAAVRFAQEQKIKATHVPFRGGGGAMQAILGNQVQFLFVSVVAAAEFAKHGDFRLLAVTAEQRAPSFPDVPTFAEQGMADFTPVLWYGYVVPAKTPPEVVARLRAAYAQAAGDKTVQQRLVELGLQPKLRNGLEFGSDMREETRRWRRVIDDNQITMD